MASLCSEQISQRRSKSTQLYAVLSCVLTVFAPGVAAQSTLLLQDQSGAPLADVVVWPISQTTAEQVTTPEDMTAPETVGSADQISIDQRDKRFAPYVSVVKPGTEVFFPNSDDTRHHVYSFSAGNAFERKLYRANEAASVTLQATGIVALGCNIHDNMQAYIVVSNDAMLRSDDEGRVTLPQDTQALRVWHPMLGDEPIETPLSALATAETGPYKFELPFTWVDPQAPRSDAQLESLLKRFSRDPQ